MAALPSTLSFLSRVDSALVQRVCSGARSAVQVFGNMRVASGKPRCALAGVVLTLSLGGDSAAPEDAASTVFSRGLAANGSGKPA